MIISPNMGLNIPEGNDVFDYKKYLKENLEKIDENFMNIPLAEEFTATEGQTVFNLASSYTVGNNSISVEVDGVPQELGTGFTETSSTSITLSEGVPAGAVVSVNVFKTPAGINAQVSGFSSQLNSLDELKLKQIYGIKANANYFNSADSKWYQDSGFTVAAQDETSNLQSAINDLLSNGGGDLTLPLGSMLVNGSIYIKPTTKNPLNIHGYSRNVKDINKRGGTRIIKENAGVIFYVNLDESGNGVLGATEQFINFSVENVSFYSRISGVTGIKTFRTRGVYKNLSGYGLDYLIHQPDTDALTNTSYNDMSIYDNIRINQSRLGGLSLSYCDNSKLENIYLENPTATCREGIVVKSGYAVNIDNVLSSMNESITPVVAEDIIKIWSSVGVSIRGVYVEHNNFKSIINLFFSGNTKIQNVYERFDGNTAFKITNSGNITIDGFESYASRLASYYDIDIPSGTKEVNSHIKYINFNCYTYPAKTSRRPLVNGLTQSLLVKNEFVHFKVYYDPATPLWRIEDVHGNNLNTLLGTPVWDNGDGLLFPDTILRRNKGMIVTPSYVSGAIAYTPVIMSSGTFPKIAFYNGLTRVNTVDNKMSFDCLISF